MQAGVPRWMGAQERDLCGDQGTSERAAAPASVALSDRRDVGDSGTWHLLEAQADDVLLCFSLTRACPIPGSKNFESFTHSHNQIADFLSAKGGYECIDTSLSLESCGGCASVGQGRDCTAIPGAVGVGCGGGECIIFSCEHGYSLSLDGTECQKKPQHRKQHLAAHLKFRSSRAV